MRKLWLLGFGLVMAGVAAAGAQTQPAGVVSDAAAVKGLEGDLGALKGVKTLEAGFVCEKRLVMLETPLVSEGKVWIRKGDGAAAGGGVGGGAVRFSTEKPYVSELILVEGKMFVRSQHETEWTATNQAARPGLTAVMTQLGGWSTGEMGKLTEMYAVTRAAWAEAKVPARPGRAGVDEERAAVEETDVFLLTPVNKDLAVAVKGVRLAIEKKTGKLDFIEITTRQDDVTRYWFYGVKLNGALPGDVFKPTSGPVGGSP